MTEAGRKISILVAEDHAMVREGLRLVLATEGDFVWLGDAADGETALALARTLRPDVLVLDLGLPKLEGTQVLVALRAESLSTRVLVVTAREDPASVRSALATGADGFLVKSEDSRQLVRAIRTVAAGYRYVSPSVVRAFEHDEAAAAFTLAGVTPREAEILKRVAAGESSRHIAAQLGISHLTVQKHRENLGRKLGVRNAAEMAAFAIRHGFGP